MNCLLFVLFIFLATVSSLTAQQRYNYPYYRQYPSYRDYYYSYYRNYYENNNNLSGDPLFHHLGHNVRRSSHLDRYGGNHH